jgi:hypothetical protein
MCDAVNVSLQKVNIFRTLARSQHARISLSHLKFTSFTTMLALSCLAKVCFLIFFHYKVVSEYDGKLEKCNIMIT